MMGAKRYFAIVPAAGVGERMAAGRPKQYLPLCGRPVLYHALAVLAAEPRIERVVVVLAPQDTHWAQYDWSELGDKVEPVLTGGASRAASVLAGLRHLSEVARESDWVLVHDGARPCLALWHLEKLINTLSDDEVGGLLAVPVGDTLKRASAKGTALETVPREGLWRAQTPQMFRYIMLRRALESFPQATDESGAIEAAGLHPRLVEADNTNFKLTWPQDLYLAEQVLQSRIEED